MENDNQETEQIETNEIDHYHEDDRKEKISHETYLEGLREVFAIVSKKSTLPFIFHDSHEIIGCYDPYYDGLSNDSEAVVNYFLSGCCDTSNKLRTALMTINGKRRLRGKMVDENEDSKPIEKEISIDWDIEIINKERAEHRKKSENMTIEERNELILETDANMPLHCHRDLFRKKHKSTAEKYFAECVAFMKCGMMIRKTMKFYDKCSTSAPYIQDLKRAVGNYVSKSDEVLLEQLNIFIRQFVSPYAPSRRVSKRNIYAPKFLPTHSNNLVNINESSQPSENIEIMYNTKFIKVPPRRKKFVISSSSQETAQQPTSNECFKNVENNRQQNESVTVNNINPKGFERAVSNKGKIFSKEPSVALKENFGNPPRDEWIPKNSNISAESNQITATVRLTSQKDNSHEVSSKRFVRNEEEERNTIAPISTRRFNNISQSKENVSMNNLAMINHLPYDDENYVDKNNENANTENIIFDKGDKFNESNQLTSTVEFSTFKNTLERPTKKFVKNEEEHNTEAPIPTRRFNKISEAKEIISTSGLEEVNNALNEVEVVDHGNENIIVEDICKSDNVNESNQLSSAVKRALSKSIALEMPTKRLVRIEEERNTVTTINVDNVIEDEDKNNELKNINLNLKKENDELMVKINKLEMKVEKLKSKHEEKIKKLQEVMKEREEYYKENYEKFERNSKLKKIEMEKRKQMLSDLIQMLTKYTK